MAKAKIRPATDDWGTPDPREAAAYPPVLGTLPAQWAWEFLRRSPQYRGRYERLTADNGHKETHKAEDGRVTRWCSSIEALRQEFRVCPSSQNTTLDPRFDKRPLFEGIEIVTEIEVEGGREVKPPIVELEFNLALPVEPQLDLARLLLLRRSRGWADRVFRDVRPPMGKFPAYLRLLDFQAVAASDGEIGTYLFSDKSGEALRDIINKSDKAARGWQDKYLLIASHPPAAS